MAQGYYQLSTFFSETETVSQILGADAGLPLGPVMAVKGGYELSHTQTSGDTQTLGGSQGSSKSTGNLLWASFARQLTSLMSAGVWSSYSIQSRGNIRIWNSSLFTTYDIPGGLSLSSSIGSASRSWRSCAKGSLPVYASVASGESFFLPV